VCPFCKDKTLVIDYKRIDQMQRFMNDRGKIAPRRATGCCARHQRRVAVALKRARHLALMPYTVAQLRASRAG